MNSQRPLAVVTGAARGIGAGIALELAVRGFDLALTDIMVDGAQDTVAVMQEHGARVKLFKSDLGCIEDHDKVVDEITQWGGPIACLVNNAGIPAPQRGDLLEVTPQAYDRVLDINLRGTFFFTQSVARKMIAMPLTRPRSVITVSSVSVEMASIERAEYCLSKSALGMLTKLFALRLAGEGVGVFEVRPGIIRTPMTEGVSSVYDQRIADGLVPMGRWGFPQDVARAVAVLADGNLSFSTGSVIHVDGALSIARI